MNKSPIQYSKHRTHGGVGIAIDYFGSLYYSHQAMQDTCRIFKSFLYSFVDVKSTAMTSFNYVTRLHLGFRAFVYPLVNFGYA